MTDRKTLILVHILTLLILLPIAVGGWFYPLPQGEGAGTEVGEAWKLSQASPSEIAAVPGEEPLPAAFSQRPDYDSGWVALNPGEIATLEHGLQQNPDQFRVDLEFRSSGELGIHQAYPGSPALAVPRGSKSSDQVTGGACWRDLNETHLTLYRRPLDTEADEVRARIWVDPNPDYDSDWVSRIKGSGRLINKFLEADPETYVLNLEHRSPGEQVNQGCSAWYQAAPGKPEKIRDWLEQVWVVQASSENAAQTIKKEEPGSSELRLRVWISPDPDFDSGWVSIHKGQVITLAHELGQDPDDYLVDIEYRSVAFTLNQIADWFDGKKVKLNSDEQVSRPGAYWGNLTSDEIRIYRNPKDQLAEKVRLRIWSLPPENHNYPFYLPVVMTEVVEPAAP